MPATLIFDLNKVLVTYDGVDVDEEYRRLFGVGQRQFWTTGKGFFSEYELGRLTGREYFRKILLALGRDPSLVNHALDLHERGFRVVPGMADLLDELRCARHRLLLLAGDGHDSIKFKLDRFDLRKYFQAVYSTAEFGMSKEDSRLYEFVIARESLGLGVVFIDDRAANLAAAARVGLLVVEFAGVDQLRDQLAKLGVLADKA